MDFKNILVEALIITILFMVITDVHGKRGRGRNRSKSRVQIGLPITGKYRDPESDQYYNHNDVMALFSQIVFFVKNIYLISGS